MSDEPRSEAEPPGDGAPPPTSDPWAGLPPPPPPSDPWSTQPPAYGGLPAPPPGPPPGYGQPGYGQPGYGQGGYNPGGYQQPWPPTYQAAPQTNGMAIASMVLGILWLYWIGSVLALVFGYIAKRQIDESQGTQTGRGMAIAGIVLGWIGIGFIAVALFLGLLFATGSGFV